MARKRIFAHRLVRRLSSQPVPTGASGKILVLCAAVALGWSAAAIAATGGASSPTGASGVTGASGTTGTTGATTLTPLAKLNRKMAAAMKPLGSNSGAYVYDLTSGQVLYDDDGAVPRSPASVEKLYTLTAALKLFGPSGTLTTAVDGVGTLEPDGVWDGNLYLRGGGDPTFGDLHFIKDWYGDGASVGALAAKLVAATHITRVDGSIIGDESYFDSLRGDPASDFAPVSYTHLDVYKRQVGDRPKRSAEDIRRQHEEHAQGKRLEPTQSQAPLQQDVHGQRQEV